MEPPSRAEAEAAWGQARWTRVGRWRVRHREAGRGPAVVLAHGLGASADYWYRNGPPLAAAGFRVLAPDLPGFGETHAHRGLLTLPEQAEALLAWQDAVGLGQAVLVGHSLSCQLVLEMTAAHPSRVLGLVLAGPTGDPRSGRLLRQAWGLLRDVPREPPRLVYEVARAYLMAGPRRVWRTWLDAGRETPLPLLARIGVPAAVVVGCRDPVVAPEFAAALAGGLPRGRLVWIAGGTHAVHFSRAAEFNAVVAEVASG